MKRSLAHTVWECKYHVVWVPRKRRKVVYGKLRKEIGQILRRLCEYKGVELIEGNACIDHIHMCIAIPPKYAVSTVVGYLKGKSAIHIARTDRGKERNFTGENFWARGYFVSTVGADEDAVREDIRDQEQEDIRLDQLKLFK